VPEILHPKITFSTACTVVAVSTLDEWILSTEIENALSMRLTACNKSTTEDIFETVGGGHPRCKLGSRLSSRVVAWVAAAADAEAAASAIACSSLS